MNRADNAEADSLFAMLLTIAALAMAFATVLLAHAVLRIHASSWQRPAGLVLPTVALIMALAGTLALEIRSASIELRFAFATLAFGTAIAAHTMVARQLRLDVEIAASSALAVTLLTTLYAALALVIALATLRAASGDARAIAGQRARVYARFLAVVTVVAYAVVWLS